MSGKGLNTKATNTDVWVSQGVLGPENLWEIKIDRFTVSRDSPNDIDIYQLTSFRGFNS